MADAEFEADLAAEAEIEAEVLDGVGSDWGDESSARQFGTDKTNSPHAGHRAGNARKDRAAEEAARSRSTSPDPEQAAREAREQAREQASRQKIDRVLSAANSFEVLELPVRETSAQDVLKAYRVLSLKVHPDKAPVDYLAKATEAQQKLSDAKDELSDSDKQKELREDIEATRAAEEAEAAREAAKPVLVPWQVDIDARVSEPVADDRDLLYVHGPGAVGMTFMARYLKDTYGDRVIVLDSTSPRHALLAICEAQDRLNATGESAIIIFDQVRAQKLSTELFIIVETAKGGIFQSQLKPIQGKTLECKLDLPPHVLISSNQGLTKKDLENLTADRWNYMAIDPDTLELREMQCAIDWMLTITEDRYKLARKLIDGDKEDEDKAGGPNQLKELVRDCFEVDTDATDKLSVRDHLHPVMKDAGFDKSHHSLGIILNKTYKQELKDGTIKRGRDVSGSHYIGLRIKGAAGPP